MAPRVMTVSGPIPPEQLGFTLPHEHTGIYLWHVQTALGLLGAHPRRGPHRRRAARLPPPRRRAPWST